jgi:hypothetical protein
MTWKKTAATAFAVVGLGLGAATMLQPGNDPTDPRARTDQQVQDLSDSHERWLGRHEDAADDLRNAETDRLVRPGEHRPGLPSLRLPGK